MKTSGKIFGALLLVLVIAGCAQNLEPLPPEAYSGKVFYAEFASDTETKTYLDESASLYWTEGDEISIFQSSANERYRFAGSTGDAEGAFDPVGSSAPGTLFSRNYGVYPYLSTTASTTEGQITYTLPATQDYVENSFGLGANLMVAVTKNSDDDVLQFKNVCSYLKLNIYGGVRARYIRLRGNNDEILTGSATITAAYGSNPAIVISSEGGKTITLDCGEAGILTGSSSSPTSFFIVVPPITFENGFTIEIENTAGNKFEKSTTKSQTFKRNVIKPMQAFECNLGASCDLLTFALSDGTNTYEAFDIHDGIVDVQVPNDMDLTNVAAVFTHSGASVKVGDAVQTSGVSTQDFSDFVNPVEYEVYAESGTSEAYTIRVFDIPVVIAETPGRTAITSKTEWIDDCIFKIRTADGAISDYGTTKLRGRGNTTWTKEKKPYAVKFNSKTYDVLGMPAHKRWCLLSNIYSYFFGNMLGYELGRRNGLEEWTPHGAYVELILNGEHLGTYLLVEQIKIDANRVNIQEMTSADTDEESITGGYLYTYDTTFDEVNKFHSEYYNMPVMFKDPDEDVLVTAQFEYLQNYINNFEASLKNDTRFAAREYLDYINLDSFIGQWFARQIAGTWRTGSTDWIAPRSEYYYKDRGGKINAGPVWDFDSYFMNKNLLNTIYQGPYYSRLLQDDYFKARIKEEWIDYKNNIEGNKESVGILSYLDSLYMVVKRSAQRDYSMWYDRWNMTIPSLTSQEQYELISEYLPARIKVIDDYLNSLTVSYDGKSGSNEDFSSQDDGSDDFDFGF